MWWQRSRMHCNMQNWSKQWYHSCAKEICWYRLLPQLVSISLVITPKFLPFRAQLGLGCFTKQKLGVYSLTLLREYGGTKIKKLTIFLFFKIPSSSVFVLALKFPQISQNSAKSCAVLVQKGQIFVLENYDARKNKLKY